MGSDQLAVFEANLKKANKVLKYIGLPTDDAESDQTFMERIRSKKFFWFFFVMLYSELLGELAWFVEKGVIGNHFIEATYTLPCATLCFLGTAKTYYRIKHGNLINELIYTFRRLQSSESECGIYEDPIAYESILKILKTLDLAIKVLFFFNTCALIAFMLGPLAIMLFLYLTTGVVELRFPFLILYPFNAFDLRIYPFIYIHQIIGGSFAVYTMYGPDCLYYLFCAFVEVQFCALHYDMEKIVPPSSNLRQTDIDAYRNKFRTCMMRHRELIRCVDLIETIYCKSSFFNFMSSSLLLCLAGFNIVSVKLSQAVYNSHWYNLDTKMAKDLFMVLMRSQKPCKLTAYSFADINLTAFTRILSTSWSYFALLQSVYNRK